MDDHAAFVKFIEQAFEWDITSYNFYPYYWGARADWAQLYQHDNNDPLFRSFMQSGMARVIVTVRPGFEKAVRFYMQTGNILFQKTDEDAPDKPSEGEIDLMKYYQTYYDITRTIISESDLLKVIWLTKIKVLW